METAKPKTGHYDAHYNNFAADVYSEVRREAFKDDIGQNSWLTADEQDQFLDSLRLSPGKKLLDVACGAGGPALRIVSKTRCSLVGIDSHEQAVATAQSLALERGLGNLAEFRVADAGQPLPFSGQEFDAITCIDAINHLLERARVISDWARMLKSGGRLLFTDPITVTGPLTKEEIDVRSSIGSFLFVPEGYDERILGECGLRLLIREDVTQSMADLAERRMRARAGRSDALCAIEGDESFSRQQHFFEVAARIARERRLSRYIFVAEKL